MSSGARHVVIEMISDKLGFPFNEEELSPKTRRQIGITSKKVEELTHLLELKTSYESNSTSYFLYSFIAGFFGAILLIPAAYNPPELSYPFTIMSWPCLGASFILFWKAIADHNRSNEIKSKINALEDTILEEVSHLADLVNAEISLLYESRIRPTIRHVSIDFAKIMEVAKNLGITLETIECPHCGGSLKLPKTGDYLKCPYCGKTIKVIDVFDKLKEILSSI
ncbi:MAG: hypothetical protein NDF55_03525 [archaeon GB-1867-005]|nr:hypothetical protein [Candidatus Culexmicrobium cathedralense]